ncbi:hypothetical protein JX266_004875 [Neoarthrinium moseri]|nr:hypothetical protein JX266_004875 [Neoarthrinium moseri]
MVEPDGPAPDPANERRVRDEPHSTRNISRFTAPKPRNPTFPTSRFDSALICGRAFSTVDDSTSAPAPRLYEPSPSNYRTNCFGVDAHSGTNIGGVEITNLIPSGSLSSHHAHDSKMDDGQIPEHYYTYDGRLASFQSVQPVSGRKSTAKNKGPKALAWPHKRIEPTNLARAGFYFDPTPEQPDNAVCFLCQKRIGGWEDGDDPVEEHVRLSPGCGWAIVTAIESSLGEYHLDDPSHPDMMEARKATFGSRWPHEGKRGWKCKVKQMVDAGWKYTPTLDSDDMATCTYCQLALDGWEPSDKPMNEHYRRSPECPFFRLIDQYQQGPTKKTAKGKGTRTSKASRLSSQSVATFTSEAPSTLEQSADHDDSVMTTTSVVTAGGTKRGRAKKATTAKGKKTRAKKEEPVEILEDPPEEELPPPPPPKPTRGRKRASDAVDDSVLTNAEAPAPKKRATRGRPSNTVNSSVIEPQGEQDMVDDFPAPPAKTAKKKGRPSNTRKTRKASTASTASSASLPEHEQDLPNDEELDRQLEADLDRPLSDDDMIAADSDAERKKAPVKGKGKKATSKKTTKSTVEPLSEDHAMFDPTPAEINDADVSAELKELRERMAVEEQTPLEVPKKGRKAGTRKVSKQTKAQKAQAASEAPAEPESEVDAEPATVIEDAPAPTEPVHQHDVSIASNATVLKSSTTAAPAPKKRGRPRKNSTQPKPQSAVEEVPPQEIQTSEVDFADPLQNAATPRPSIAPAKRKKSLPPPPAPDDELQAPSTPGAASIAPAQAAKQSTVSPSQSPQSSDAENQPPSSKPSNTASSTRVALAPVASTPVRSSPSRRNNNLLGGLQSNQPWAPADIEMIFEDLDKENAVPSSDLLKGLQLSSPEKKMTVEEWIYHNAGLAEQKLKIECETMVSKFESEGGRAMRSLEELIVE